MTRRRRVPAGRRVILTAVVACLILAVAGAARVPPVRAASPEPTEAIVGDTRSPGEGPGLVGAPFLAIGGVLLLGVVAAGLTIVYVRAPGGPASGQPSRFGSRDDRRGTKTTGPRR